MPDRAAAKAKFMSPRRACKQTLPSLDTITGDIRRLFRLTLSDSIMSLQPDAVVWVCLSCCSRSSFGACAREPWKAINARFGIVCMFAVFFNVFSSLPMQRFASVWWKNTYTCSARPSKIAQLWCPLSSEMSSYARAGQYQLLSRYLELGLMVYDKNELREDKWHGRSYELIRTIPKIVHRCLLCPPLKSYWLPRFVRVWCLGVPFSGRLNNPKQSKHFTEIHWVTWTYIERTTFINFLFHFFHYSIRSIDDSILIFFHMKWHHPDPSLLRSFTTQLLREVASGRQNKKLLAAGLQSPSEGEIARSVSSEHGKAVASWPGARVAWPISVCSMTFYDLHFNSAAFLLSQVYGSCPREFWSKLVTQGEDSVLHA